MRTGFLIATLFVAVPAAAQNNDNRIDPDSVLALPTEWDTYFLAFLEPGPEHEADRTQEELGTLMNNHFQFQLRLQAEGKAVAAGGIPPEPDWTATGLTLLRAESIEQAQDWATSDPAVEAGYFTVTVRAWYVPKGRFPEQR